MKYLVDSDKFIGYMEHKESRDPGRPGSKK